MTFLALSNIVKWMFILILSLFGAVIFNNALNHLWGYILHIIKLREIESCMPVNNELQTLLSVVFYTSYDIQLTKKNEFESLYCFPAPQNTAAALLEKFKCLLSDSVVLINVLKIAVLLSAEKINYKNLQLTSDMRVVYLMHLESQISITKCMHFEVYIHFFIFKYVVLFCTSETEWKLISFTGDI